MTLKQAYWDARYKVGRQLSKVGERIGVDALTYNTVIMDLFGHIAGQTAPPFVKAMLSVLPPVRSAVDLGCGTGHYVAVLRAEGIEATGFEYSRYARDYAAARLGIAIEPFDLTDVDFAAPSADLAMSLEVAEHLPPELGDRLVAQLAASAPVVVFSAAQPGQGGTGHINEQPIDYWCHLFERRGFTPQQAASAKLRELLTTRAPLAPWLARNVNVFGSQAWK